MISLSLIMSLNCCYTKYGDMVNERKSLFFEPKSENQRVFISLLSFSKGGLCLTLLLNGLGNRTNQL